MFDFKAWLKNGLVQGYSSGEFSRPGVVTMTANYIARGMLVEADAAEIDTECTKIDEAKAAQEAAQKAAEEAEQNPPPAEVETNTAQ